MTGRRKDTLRSGVKLTLAAVPKRGFDIGGFACQEVKAPGRGLPFYKLKVVPCGSKVSADYLGICESQTRLPLKRKEASLCSTAFGLLQFVLGLGVFCGFGQQLGCSNGEG